MAHNDAGLRGRVMLFLKGMAMGVADSVPGVSGGTIAVISGIYEDLILALRSCNPIALGTLVKHGITPFWRQIHGSFLLTLISGILLSLILMANTVLYLLSAHAVLVMAFFMGLVMASCWLLRRETGDWGAVALILFTLGFVLTGGSSLLNPLVGSSSFLYVFLCGMLAICAMILPGISGAFILILLGVYEPMLEALRGWQLDVILVFALGCAIGLLSFSHLLAWLFHYYRGQAYAFITGMLAASLLVLWPWRTENPAGPGLPVMPSEYSALAGASARVPEALFFVVLGFGLIMLLARLSAPRHSV
jgi:putative membrane protein